ncbi:MAG: hypothetical protein Q7R95_09680 [bacterium]|nr:hypothetical protein [bacterium]
MKYQQPQTFPFSKLAFIDIDNTITLNGSGTGNPELILKIRKLLLKKQFLFCPTTSRTEEMMMSSKTYEQSKKIFSFKRPIPNLFLYQGKYSYKDPLLVEPKSILDGDIIISSSGSKIYIKQSSYAYQEDDCFYDANFPKPHIWRNSITALIHQINKIYNVALFSELENVDRYINGTNNVYPPDYRIQLFFNNVVDKLFFIDELLKIKTSSNDISIQTLFTTDDSNPEKNKFSIYLTPKNGKISAVDHVINHFKTDLQISNPEILFVGDSWPDLQMGLNCAPNNPNVTFFLIGGSRLTKYITDPNKISFAGESLVSMKQNIIETDNKGIFLFKNNNLTRKIIISDIIFPEKSGPDSLIEFLS